MNQPFTSKIIRQFYAERMRIFLILSVLCLLAFVGLLLFSDDQISFTELFLSRYPIGIGMVVSFVVLHMRMKYFVYQIEISTENIILSRLIINKEEVIKIGYENLEVQVTELVRRNSPKAAAYALRFVTNGKKYSMNKNGEWTFRQIHQIISELENVRKLHHFKLDGFHFEKDISERIKPDNPHIIR